MGLNDIMKIGNVIKKIRTEKGLTQKKMAELLQIPYSTYSNYENNNRTPDTDTLFRIADTLGVEVWDLFGVDERTAKTSNLDYDEQGTMSIKSTLSDTAAEIMFLVQQLNKLGEQKALEQVKLLTKIPEYRWDHVQTSDPNAEDDSRNDE